MTRPCRLVALVLSSLMVVACGGGGGGSGGGGSLTVSYDANGATSGTVPHDAGGYSAGQAATVLANPGGLARTGFRLAGWQTSADSSGTYYAPGSTITIGSTSVTLYALWTRGTAYAVARNAGAVGSVSQYWISAGGGLVPMPAPWLATSGNDSRYVSVDPAGRFLYASNVRTNDVAMLSIDQETGALTAMSPATIPSAPGTLVYPFGSAVHPTGKWLYVVNNQVGSVSQLAIGATGGLGTAVVTPLPTPETGQIVAPYAIAVVPSGRYAFVVSQLGNSTAHGAIHQFTIDLTTGALTANGVLRTVDPNFGYTTPATIKVASVGSTDYAYVGNYQKGTIWAFKVQADGTLVSAGTTNTGALNVTGLAVHPAGKWLYAAINTGLRTSIVAQFAIGQADGSLAPLAPATAGGAGYAAASMAVEPSGQYAYVTGGDSSWGSKYITQYAIDQASGVLSLLTPSSVQTQTGPCEIVTVGP